MRHFVGMVALLALCGSASAQWHSMDTTAPQGVVSLSELLRGIQFYKSLALHCDAGSEDGFAPGTGEQTCAPHDLDYTPQNWAISLSELLRAIQFYNALGYTVCPEQSTEDGFCPNALPVGEGEGEIPCDDVLSPLSVVSIAAGSFSMGRPYTDTGYSGELPVHAVQLDAYDVGTFEISNQEFVDVLNCAYKQGKLKSSGGGAYTGGLIYAHGQPIAETYESDAYSAILFSAGKFSVQSRSGTGAISYSMADHPVVGVSWYGAVVWCNWRSEKDGLAPCYDLGDWSRFEPVRNGYRLPTEAEWERAAAWDGTQHWRFGFTSETIDTAHANFYNGLIYTNPLGLGGAPYTSPVGWFDGVNLSPNRNEQSVDSQSPAGCYDMSGNVREWCHDWYVAAYYATSPASNPLGGSTGTYRVVRGGAWANSSYGARAASRLSYLPDLRSAEDGFRIARTPGGVAAP